MADEKRPDQVLRRIVLPSGRTIEVLRAVEPPAAPSLEETGTPTRATDDPHVCASCGSRLVYPIAWSAADEQRWSVDLRCPNCERAEVVVLDQRVAEHFDEELERGAETLMSDLARLTEANMRESLDRFLLALEADAIEPMDF